MLTAINILIHKQKQKVQVSQGNDKKSVSESAKQK